jgi:hypothetical protein
MSMPSKTLRRAWRGEGGGVRDEGMVDRLFVDLLDTAVPSNLREDLGQIFLEDCLATVLVEKETSRPDCR